MPIIQENGRWKSVRLPNEDQKHLQELLNTLKPEERDVAESIIKDYAEKGKSDIIKTAYEIEWDPKTGPPVPIAEWVNSDFYLGETGRTLYPIYKQDVIEFFEGGYREVIMCLHPETIVPLLSGKSKSIKELAETWEKDKQSFWVYGYKDGRIVPALAQEPRKTGEDDYYKVTVDDGSFFICNSRHQMVMRDGNKKMVKDMTPGDSLMPCNIRFSSKDTKDRLPDYEMVLHPDTEKWQYTHRMAVSECPEKLKGINKKVVHHINCDRKDNRPENLQWMSWTDHTALHNKLMQEAMLDPEKHKKIIENSKKGLDIRWNGPGNELERKKVSKQAKDLAKKGHQGKISKESWNNRTEEYRQKLRERTIQRNKTQGRTRLDVNRDSIRIVALSGALTLKDVCKSLNCSTKTVFKALKDAGTSPDKFLKDIRIELGITKRPYIRGRASGYIRVNKLRKIGGKLPDKKVRTITFDQIIKTIESGAYTQGAACTKLKCSRSTVQAILDEEGVTWTQLKGKKKNHHVISIEKIGHGPVYCMTVPDTANFAIFTTEKDYSETNSSLNFSRNKFGVSPCVVSSNTGGTSSGKSTYSLVLLTRLIYELCCLKNPQESLGIAAGDPIYIIPISIRVEEANKLVFGGLSKNLNLAPFFQGKFTQTQEEIRFKDKNIVIAGGSSTISSTLGRNVIACILDEINFYGKARASNDSSSGETMDKAQMIYDSVARRVKTRFGHSGVKGLVIMISSKKGTEDFTERRIKEAIKENDETVYTKDYSILDVRKEYYDKQKWYKVCFPFGGGIPTIIEDNEAPVQNSQVYRFPQEFLSNMAKDPVGTVRDVIGVSISTTATFIQDRVAVEDMMKAAVPNLFIPDVWTTNGSLSINWKKVMTKNARDEPIPVCCPGSKRHLHIDLSRNRCATGFVLGHRAENIEAMVRDKQGEKVIEEAPFIHIDGVLRIVAPPGGEIEHEEIRDLVSQIAKGGIPLRSITMDQWCFTPNEQLLKNKGFIVEYMSVVRNIEPYLTLRSLIYERRIESPVSEHLRRELFNLELNKDGTKVEHAPNFGKDVSDALAGVCYYLIQNGKAYRPIIPSKGFMDSSIMTDKITYLGNGDFKWGDEKTDDFGGSDGLPTWVIV